MSNSDSDDSEIDDYQMDVDSSQINAGENNDDADGMLDTDPDELNSGEDTDDDDENDDEDEDKLINKYLTVLQEISKDKYNYDNYVLLVDIGHEIADLEKIRESCELFSTAYPLAPEIWLRWLKIELNIATGENEFKRVHHLFRRAFSDYFCASLAVEYANFAAKSPKADTIWNEIISTYALDCMKGRSLFEAWRTYIIDTQPESPEKYKKLCEIYEQELSIPLCDMEETYIEFKVLCEKHPDKYVGADWTRIDEKYHRAKEHLSKMLPFEKELLELDRRNYHDRANTYTKYIDECREFLSEQTIQVLYEKMITDCCLNASCWLKYIKFIQNREDYAKPITMEESPVFSQTDWDIVNRALRNCTWSADLYIEKMCIGERMELPKQEVQNITESAFVATVNSPESFLSVWIEYVSYLRRNINVTNEKEVEVLRANFSLGWDSLERQCADPYCELLKVWGRLEYGVLQDVTRGKELWTSVMENDNNVNKSALWIEFAHLELTKGVDAARKVYRKASGILEIDDIHTIISAWTRLERCNGTLDQLKACQEHCQKVLDQHSNFYKKSFQRKKQTNSTHGASKQHKDPQSHHLKRKGVTPQENNKKTKTDSKLFGSKNTNNKTETGSVARKHKLTDGNNERSNKRKKVENVSQEENQQQQQQHQQQRSSEKDDVTVFLSNLSYEITSEDIKNAFPELNIANINLVTSLNGKSRGFGYVELASTKDVELAISFDRRPINGRPTYISSVLRDKEKRGKFKYAADKIELQKLFVKGLPFDATKEELEKLFGEFGGIKDIRMVCHKSGAFKGIAYIEFEQEASASKAVLKLDQFRLRDLTLTVAISAPPPKEKPNQLHTVNDSVGLGQGRRNNINKGDQKPRLSFIPRSVQKNVLEQKATEPQQPSTSAKSNDDFRKLLIKE